MKKEAKKYYLKKLEKFSDKDDRIFSRVELKKDEIERVHISAVCGKAMASIAGLFRDGGFKISGSDADCQPPMSLVLDKLDLESKVFSEENLENVDLVVVGNVCRPDNPEAVYARKNKIPQLSGAEAVGEFFIDQKKSIVVAGTHGKTTTTSLLSTIFLEAEKDPAYLIGGVLQRTGTSYSLGSQKTDYFIIEGDEYDTAYFDKAPKFLHYKPYISLITSVEFDHADIYNNLNDYRQAFKFLIEENNQKGFVLLWDEIENIDEFLEIGGAKKLTYGFKESSDISISNLRQEGQKQFFDLKIFDKDFKEIEISMSGKHNILNSAASFAIAILESLEEEKIRKALKEFSGVKKRQEVLYQENNLLIIDDYAHHPTAVKTTLEGLAQKYPDKKITAIFEPRSNTSRMKVFQKDYLDSFASAEKVILAVPPFREMDQKENFIDIDLLVSDLNKKGIEAINLENSQKIFDFIKDNLSSGEMVVIMSNGDFGHLAQRLADYLKSNFGG